MEKGIVYLIGADHIIQHKGCLTPAKDIAIAQFQQHVREQVDWLGIGTLAEEFSSDAVRLNGVSASTVEEVAVEQGLQHLFCDPGIAERQRLGIGLGTNSSIEREAYWLEQLEPFRTVAVLFVCGDNHVYSFSQKLSSAGFTVQVLSTGWGRELNPIRTNNR